MSTTVESCYTLLIYVLAFYTLEQCLSTGCIVHPRVYQNFPRVYRRDGVHELGAL